MEVLSRFMPENMNFLQPEERPSGNLVDGEFLALEKEFAFAERGPLAFRMVEQILEGDHGAGMGEFLAFRIADGRDGVKHYLLPGISKGGLERESLEDLSGVREHYDDRARLVSSGEHLFIRAGQGEMWRVPKNKNPYILCGLSECSALIGESESDLFVAHISYSQLSELDAALEFLKQNKVSPEDVYVAASIGEAQTAAAKPGGFASARAGEAQDYVRRGVRPENIKPFAAALESKDSGQRRWKGLTQVLAAKDGFYQRSYDESGRQEVLAGEKAEKNSKDEFSVEF